MKIIFLITEIIYPLLIITMSNLKNNLLIISYSYMSAWIMMILNRLFSAARADRDWTTMAPVARSMS